MMGMMNIHLFRAGFAAALFLGAACAADACTGLYVGKGVSADGQTYLARTEDDWGMKFWHFGDVVPHRVRTSPETLTGAFGFRRELPLETYRYVCFPRATQFGTGRLAAEAINEKGFAMSAVVTAWPKHELIRHDPFPRDGCSWETMPDYLGACCATAREAVDLLARIVKENGCFEGGIYMLADQKEVWYFEIYTGHHWAAVRMPEDCVATWGNEYMLGEVDPSAPGFRCSEGLFDLIEKAGVAVRGKGGRIHLAASCAAPLDDFHNMRTWWGRRYFAPGCGEAKRYEKYRRYDLFFRPEGKVTLAQAIEFLRSRYEGTELCPEWNHKDYIKFVGSENQEQEHVIAIRDGVPPVFALVSWTALGPAEHSVFGPVPALLDRFEPDWSCDSPAGAPESYHDVKSVAHRIRKLATLARVDRERYGIPIRRYWKELEKQYADEWERVFLSALKAGDRDRAVAALSEYSRKCQREVSAKTDGLIDQLMNYMVVDVRTCWWHPAPDGYGIVPVPENPPFDPK